MKEIMKFEEAWFPDDRWIENSNIYKQMKKYGIGTYEEFLNRSFHDYDWFWRAYFEDTGFVWFKEYERTVDVSGGKMWPKWFVNGRINWTYNALDKNPPDKVALIWEGDNGNVVKYTYDELRREVNKLCNTLISLGVKEGDAVGIYLPFIPEVAISLLAVSRIGATVIPLFSGFGPHPIIVRLKDADTPPERTMFPNLIPTTGS